jgi:hypothetical protein
LRDLNLNQKYGNIKISKPKITDNILSTTKQIVSDFPISTSPAVSTWSLYKAMVLNIANTQKQNATSNTNSTTLTIIQARYLFIFESRYFQISKLAHFQIGTLAY